MLRNLVILALCAGAAAAVLPAWLTPPPAGMEALQGSADRDRTRVSPEPPRVVSGTNRSVSIPADARGHFQAEFKMNGRRVDGLIDTGATLVAINESTARRLGLKLKDADFRHQVETANGTARAAAARLDTLSLGRIHLTDVEAVVLEDRALSGTLVGMSFLKRLDGFRVEDGTLVLRQ